MLAINTYELGQEPELARKLAQILVIPREVTSITLQIEFKYFAGSHPSWDDPGDAAEIDPVSTLVESVELEDIMFVPHDKQLKTLDTFLESYCWSSRLAEEMDSNCFEQADKESRAWDDEYDY